jgi:mono/diheme cytochrome c family protein
VKYVFGLTLLLVVGAAGVMGFAVVTRFINNMTETPRIVTGERVFAMPAGVVARGGEPTIPREARDRAAALPNPVPSTPASIAVGEQRFQTFCAPCHGPRGKGDGLVSAKFVPPPDLGNAGLQKVRTDGYWYSYISVGGAVMPAYGEALSPEERWHVVNFLRTLAAK